MCENCAKIDECVELQRELDILNDAIELRIFDLSELKWYEPLKKRTLLNEILEIQGKKNIIATKLCQLEFQIDATMGKVSPEFQVMTLEEAMEKNPAMAQVINSLNESLKQRYSSDPADVKDHIKRTGI